MERLTRNEFFEKLKHSAAWSMMTDNDLEGIILLVQDNEGKVSKYLGPDPIKTGYAEYVSFLSILNVMTTLQDVSYMDKYKIILMEPTDAPALRLSGKMFLEKLRQATAEDNYSCDLARQDDDLYLLIRDDTGGTVKYLGPDPAENMDAYRDFILDVEHFIRSIQEE